MKKRTILVTGAGGMVGSYAREVFSDFNIILTDIMDGYVYLNIEDEAITRKLIGMEKPDYVLHLAAATDVDRCELEPEWARQVNTEGAKNVALACKEFNIPMIYISTAAVFNGEKAKPYIETDQISPSNKYGISKYEGEKIVMSLVAKFYIIRAGWMIGGGENDKKFVGRVIYKIMSGEKLIKAVNDKFGSITYARDLLRGIKGLIKTDRFGVYHMANEGMQSRYDIVIEIMKILDKKHIEVISVSSDEFPLPAPRGRSEALENYNLRFLGLNHMKPWKEALREYITQEFRNLYAE